MFNLPQEHRKLTKVAKNTQAIWKSSASDWGVHEVMLEKTMGRQEPRNNGTWRLMESRGSRESGAGGALGWAGKVQEGRSCYEAQQRDDQEEQALCLALGGSL